MAIKGCNVLGTLGGTNRFKVWNTWGNKGTWFKRLKFRIQRTGSGTPEGHIQGARS